VLYWNVMVGLVRWTFSDAGAAVVQLLRLGSPLLAATSLGDGEKVLPWFDGDASTTCGRALAHLPLQVPQNVSGL
jgi:hypothetical protein